MGDGRLDRRAALVVLIGAAAAPLAGAAPATGPRRDDPALEFVMIDGWILRADEIDQIAGYAV